MTTPDDPRWSPGSGAEPGAWQPPQYGPPGNDTGAEPFPAGAPANWRGRGKAIAIAAAAVVLLGGGIATYVAVSSGSAAGGSATPRQAVERLFGDLNHADLLGVLDDLPPGEREALAQPIQDSVAALERDGVLRPGTDLHHLSGIGITARNLSFTPRTAAVNDHVQIVQLTGGTITFSADAAKLPLAGDLLRAMGARGSGPASVRRTVDIAAKVRQQGALIRLATQKVDGRWYPSLLYTIADSTTTQAGMAPPSPADAIPARGAGSPDDAVRQMVTALLHARLRAAIALTSPDEDAVLHDYGSYLLGGGRYQPAPVVIDHMTFVDTPIAGGTRVNIKSLAITGQHGQHTSMTVTDNCVVFHSMGQSRRVCRGALLAQLRGAPLPPAGRQAVAHLVSGFDKIGIDTSQSNGRWYVNPIRTVLDIGPALLSGLTRSDIQHLISATR